MADAFSPGLPADAVRARRLEMLLALVEQLLQDAKGPPGPPGPPGSGGGGGGSGGVTMVSNSDGSLTISPTSGAAVASLNVGNANTWTALQRFASPADGNRLVKINRASNTDTARLFSVATAVAEGDGDLVYIDANGLLSAISLAVSGTSSYNTIKAVNVIFTNPDDTHVPYFSRTATSSQVALKTFNSTYASLILGTELTTDVGLTVVGLASQTGVMLQLQGTSSTTTGRPQADFDTTWVDNTDASRKSRFVLNAWDTAARECFRGEASGSAAEISFFGGTANTKQTVTGNLASATTVAHLVATLQSLMTALATKYNLVTDSTT